MDDEAREMLEKSDEELEALWADGRPVEGLRAPRDLNQRAARIVDQVSSRAEAGAQPALRDLTIVKSEKGRGYVDLRELRVG